MKVLIVAKTKMGGSVCVGAVSFEAKRSLRLLNKYGGNQPGNTPFEIGQIWDIQGEFPQPDKIKPPHTEDFHIQAMNNLRQQADVIQFLLQNVQIARGNPTGLFDGHLQWTGNGHGYISTGGLIPCYSTCFWQPNKSLRLAMDDNKPYYHYDANRSLKYGGLAQPISEIHANKIVRVSLARWWRPTSSDVGERCYLQLSGWYE